MAQLVAGIKDCFAFWLGKPCFLSLQIFLAFATQACFHLAECTSLHPANGAALPFHQQKLALARSTAQQCVSPKWTKWNLWGRGYKHILSYLTSDNPSLTELPCLLGESKMLQLYFTQPSVVLSLFQAVKSIKKRVWSARQFPR